MNKTKTNNELTIDQLKAISGGATAICYGLIAARMPKAYPPSIECKVPPRFSKTVNRVTGSGDPGGDDV